MKRIQPYVESTRVVRVVVCNACGSDDMQAMVKLRTGVRFFRCRTCGKDALDPVDAPREVAQ